MILSKLLMSLPVLGYQAKPTRIGSKALVVTNNNRSKLLDKLMALGAVATVSSPAASASAAARCHYDVVVVDVASLGASSASVVEDLKGRLPVVAYSQSEDACLLGAVLHGATPLVTRWSPSTKSLVSAMDEARSREDTVGAVDKRIACVADRLGAEIRRRVLP